MKAMAGVSMLVSIVVIIAGVFITIVSVVALVKVLQIAEDIRYMRSRNDVHVERPKPYKETVKLCLLISVIVIVFLLFMLVYTAGITR